MIGDRRKQEIIQAMHKGMRVYVDGESSSDSESSDCSDSSDDEQM